MTAVQSLLLASLFTVFSLVAGTPSAQAQVTLAFFDYDGTLVENRASQGGTHSTTHVIFPIRQQGIHLLAGIPENPITENLEISQQDMHKIQEFLGKGEGQPGAINRQVTLEDGRVIRPGLFYARFPETFKYFRQSPDPSRNILLEDFKRAEAKSPGGEFKGRFWQQFQDWCSNEATAKHTTILSARGHSEAEWFQLFEYWVKRGYINFPPGRVVSLTNPKFDRFGPDGEIAKRKASFLAEQSIELSRVHRTSDKNHTIVVADDEQRNVQEIRSRLTNLALSGLYPVQYFIGNAGLSSEIRASGYPEFALIQPQGQKSFVSLTRQSFFTPGSEAPLNEADDQRGSSKPTSLNMSLKKCELSFVSAGAGRGGRP